MESKKTVRVAVIGAGIAGLRAAHVLLDEASRAGRYNVAVTVFEARDRVGGRCAQTMLGRAEHGGVLVEHGPDWLRGLNGNPFYPIVHAASASAGPANGAGAPGADIYAPAGPGLASWAPLVFDPEGTPMEDDESAGIVDQLAELIQVAYELSDRPAQATVSDTPESVTEACHAMLFDAADPNFDLQLAALNLWGARTGASPDALSADHLRLTQPHDWTELFVAGTFARAVAAVAGPAAAAGALQLGTRVRSVRRAADGCSGVTVTLDRLGETRRFDDVVCTLPLGMLQDRAGRAGFFGPDGSAAGLPARLTAAIDRAGFGAIEKVFVLFREPWWTGCSAAFARRFAGRAVPRPPTDKPPAFVFAGGAVPVALALPHAPALVFYAFGPAAAAVVRAQQQQQQGEQQAAALLRILAGLLELLPCWDGADPACAPVEVQATAWSADELAGRGAVSFVPLAQMGAPADFDELVAQPDAVAALVRGSRVAGDGRAANQLAAEGIWFAGEHTAPAQGMASVSGAYISGERVADGILKKWDARLNL